jgi:hypothetical protein
MIILKTGYFGVLDLWEMKKMQKEGLISCLIV